MNKTWQEHLAVHSPLLGYIEETLQKYGQDHELPRIVKTFRAAEAQYVAETTDPVTRDYTLTLITGQLMLVARWCDTIRSLESDTELPTEAWEERVDDVWEMMNEILSDWFSEE